ncbi:glycosyltransferase [Commensalibacter communis]|uniref:glycosyltransferase n=1 Tax=Commensalibacter communis TaxID=2972786 RepID=UPI0022FF5CC0|nr:glycosyltransferase [Commensalibacter communis]CAI3946049.1 Glycosyltransferase involved in cell wall bisynthesis (RfaB) (PDB:2IV7) [Commensalibacter communis]CAI3946240.1 Glycosyltransferase involved in cell wall bisynthesis (RfaB) (PDB:2IV7) [Commensalibacter communis]
MAVIYNTNYTHNSNSYLTLAVARAAKELWGDENVVVADNMNLLSIAATHEHEVLICIDGQRTDFELIKRLRPCFKTMIFWAFEDPFMLDFNVHVTSNFDYVFTNDPSCIDSYQVEAYYLPLAGSKSIHYRDIKNTQDLDYDIFFAGTMWPNRVEVLRRLLIAFPEARFKLICPGNEYLPPLPKDLIKRIIPRPVSIESFIDFANASQVTLTMFRNYASHGDVGQATAPGPRLYELGLAGTAQVVELPSEMDEKYLKELNGVSIARNTDEVIETIANILNEKELRKKLATETQKAVLDKHLYKDRLKEIANITQADFKKKQQQEILLEKPRRQAKLRVLFVTHSTVHEHVWGGIEVYQQILSTSLVKDVEFFYWLRRRGACYLTDANGKEIERFDMPDVGWLDSMNDAGEETAFSSVINQYGFDVVHIQHLGHHTLSLPIIAKACGVGVIFSYHDFLAVCSHYNLLNYEQRYCEIDKKNIGACDICLKTSEKLEFGVQQTRRAFVSKIMKNVDVCLYGTKHSYELALKIYPVLETKKNYVMGIPSPDTTIPLKQKKYEPLNGRKLKVATVGNFIRSKGADTILSILQSANPDLYEFHIFGYMQPDYENVLREMKKDNVILHGSYGLGEVAALQVADVAMTLSIWPETYCISLSEAWQNGLIPIVTDVGALGDRVKDGVNGFKVEIGAVNTVIDRLELIRSDEMLRKQIMDNITPELWVTAADYAKELLKVYEDVVPYDKLGISNLKWDIGRLHYLPHASWKDQAPPRHIFDPPTGNDLHVELPQIVDDWAVVQGANYYLDDICYHILNIDDNKKFKPAHEFHIRGWFISPGLSNAGSLYTVLIHADSDLTIFLECQRENRADVAESFTNAPIRNGFSGQAALRGKWCEGRFRIGLINIVNGSAAFQLTTNEIEVEEGQVKKIDTISHSNQVILDDFNRIIEKDGLIRGIKLDTFIEKNILAQRFGELEYCIEHFTGFIQDGEGENAVATSDKSILKIAGWAFNRTNLMAGRMYIAFINDQSEDCFIVGTSRFMRHETSDIFQSAPLNNGFVADIRLNQGCFKQFNGHYHVYLVNIVHNEYQIANTNILVNIVNNVVEDVADSVLTEGIMNKNVQIINKKFK